MSTIGPSKERTSKRAQTARPVVRAVALHSQSSWSRNRPLNQVLLCHCHGPDHATQKTTPTSFNFIPTAHVAMPSKQKLEEAREASKGRVRLLEKAHEEWKDDDLIKMLRPTEYAVSCSSRRRFKPM